MGKGKGVNGATFSTSVLEGVVGQCHAAAALPVVRSSDSHCTGGWVDPRAGLGGWRIKSLLPQQGFEQRTVQSTSCCITTVLFRPLVERVMLLLEI